MKRKSFPRIYLTLSLILGILVQSANAQTTFFKTFGGSTDDYGRDVIETFDGGFAIAGRTLSFGIAQYDMYLIKTDANGDTLWDRTFGNFNYEEAWSLLELPGGGYLLAGQTGSAGDFNGDFYLVRTDANGNFLWDQSVGGGSADIAYDVVRASDGGFVMVGSTASFGQGMEDMYIVKTDSNGTVLWTRTFGGTKVDVARSVRQTPDGGYIVWGYTESFGFTFYDLYLVKLNAAGAVQWSKTYAGSSFDVGYELDLTSDGGFILAGSAQNFGTGNFDGSLIKTDSLGNIQWQKVYGGSNDDRLLAVEQTNDGGYAAGGRVASFGAGGSDAWFMKTDAFGNLTWSKTLGGSGTEECWSIRETSGGGYVFSGFSTSFGQGGREVILGRLDAAGNAGCNQTTPIPATNSASFTVASNGTAAAGGTTANPPTAVRNPASVIGTNCFSSGGCSLTVSVSGSDVSCNGGNDGTAIATPTGGTPGYTYSWNTVPVQTSQTATNLSTGSWCVIVTDTLACTDTTCVTINQPASLLANIDSFVNPICLSDTSGAIYASATGGTAPYSFSWNTAPTQNSSAATSLGTGNYTVTIIDTNGCNSTNGAILTAGSVIPTWVDLIGTIQSNDTLYETVGSNGWTNKGAASGQILAPGEDGGVFHIVTDLKQYYFFGLSNGNTDASQSTIGHSIYVKKGKLEARESSGTKIQLGNLLIGDTLAVIRQGASYTWLKNSIPLYTTPADTTQWLIADVALFKANSFLTNLWLTFCGSILPLEAEGIVTQNHCNSNPIGQINLSVMGGSPPYSYVWSNGDTTASVTGLTNGNYSVTLTDNGNSSLLLNFQVLSRMDWTQVNGASTIADTLTRTAPGKSWGASGARSVQILNGNSDGDFTHVVHQTNKYYYLGLAASNPDDLPTSIDYSFYVAKTTLFIREKTGYFASQGTVLVGDSLKIERIGSTINYYQNGNLLRSTSTSAALNLYVDAAIFNNGVSLYDNFVSFCTDTVPPDSFYGSLLSLVHMDCFQNNGSISVTGVGGIPPYNYQWNTSDTTPGISAITSGDYFCIISDQIGNFDTVPATVFARIVWEGFIGSTANGDTLSRTVSGGGSWATSGARSDNKILNGSDGKLTHIVTSIAKNYYLGLSDSDPDASQFTIDYAFYNNKGNLFIREQKTGYFQLYGTVNVGDTLSVERRISSMYWYQNGTQLRSIGVSPTETLRVDVSMFTPGTQIYDTYVDFCDTVPGAKRQEVNFQPSVINNGLWTGDSRQLIVYPNPALDEVWVTTNLEFSSGQLELLDLQGKLLQTQPLSIGKNRLNLSSLASGMYLLRFTADNFRVSRRLIKE